MKQRRPSIPQPARRIVKAARLPGAPALENAARLNAALVLHQQGQLSQAEAVYQDILQSDPRHFDALQLLATIAVQRKNSATAVQLFDRALEINPHHASALNNRGIALRELNRHDDALASYDCAIRIQPDYAEAHYNRGNALLDTQRHEDALMSYDRALGIKPDYAEAHYNRGNALRFLKRHDAALECYGRALNIKPDYAEALHNRGNALLELKRYEEALESYEHALKIRPDIAEALYNRGNTLQEIKRYEAALESYERALRIKPDYEFLPGTLLHTRMKICDWTDYHNNLTGLLNKISSGVKASMPFPVLALSDSLPLQRKAAEIWVNDKHPESLQLSSIPARARHEKIRIAYCSADFRSHPVSYLMAGVFESHDKSRFECTALSYGPGTNDEMRKRVESAFDHFIDIRNKSEKEVALLSRRMEIDLAIDLGGFTRDARTGIFALRAAPIQVSYIGYLGTMGAGYMDYLLADKTIISDECRPHYAEKIVYLPSYQANDATRIISERRFTRAELGLPDSGFVFCCLNNNFKITPDVFDSWMRILRQVEGSVLLLYEDNSLASANLRREAVLRGIGEDRLIFVRQLPQAEYLARYRVADLFLDTFPYNAGTMAGDALWAGLPLLTCAGQAFAGRVAASLLNAVDLPELITTSRKEYETLAVELATNPERLRQIREKLAKNRLTAPLFDTRRFTRHLEDAYIKMYERYQAGLPPDHIYA